jgi:hypothetical protein
MQTRLFLGVAAITALAGGQAFANGDDRPVTTGYFGAGYFHTEADFNFDEDIVIGEDIIAFEDIFDDDFDDDGWGAEGAAAFSLTEDFGLQVAGVVRDTRTTDTSWSIDAHAYYRDDRMLFGGFVGGGEFSNNGNRVFVSDGADIDFVDLVPFLDNDDDSFWTIGAEGEYYWPTWTLAAAAAYAGFDDDDDDAFSIDGEARWFPMPDLRLEAELGWASFNNGFGNFVFVDDTNTIFIIENDDDDDNVWNVGVSGEWQFGGGPISVYAGYEHNEFDSSDFSTDVFSIGARINFGELTLRERDQTGVSLPGLSRFSSSLGGD